MQITNFTQLIDWTHQLHLHLGKALEQGGELHQQERAQMLLAYLAEQEQKLGQTIKRFEDGINIEGLDAYVPYLYSAFEQHPIHTQRLYSQPFHTLSIPEISRVVFDVHDQIVDFYRRLMNESQISPATEILASLLEFEQEAEKSLAAQIDGMDDM